MWVVLGCVLYLSKDAKGCYCLIKVRNPKKHMLRCGLFFVPCFTFQMRLRMLVVLCSVPYLSKEATGCYPLDKYGTPKKSTYCELGVVGSVLYLSEEAKGCFSLVKYRTQNNPHTAIPDSCAAGQ